MTTAMSRFSESSVPSTFSVDNASASIESSLANFMMRFIGKADAVVSEQTNHGVKVSSGIAGIASRCHRTRTRQVPRQVHRQSVIRHRAIPRRVAPPPR